MSLPVSDKKYTCGGGHNGCAMDPNGRMTMCVLSHRDGYDLRSGSFRQGWEGRLKEIRGTKTTRETICTHCKIRTLCSMCPANGELEGGDAESPVDFLCQVAHLRAYTLGLQVPAHGDCECCSDGKQYAELQKSAECINQNSPAPVNLVPFSGAKGQLTVLNTSSSCSAGGCSSCGAHSR
jgi:radical SAM protein with 4Fe4S-binding SPASM domain